MISVAALGATGLRPQTMPRLASFNGTELDLPRGGATRPVPRFEIVGLLSTPRRLRRTGDTEGVAHVQHASAPRALGTSAYRESTPRRPHRSGYLEAR